METNMLIQISPEQLSEMIISGIREELQKFQSVSGKKSNNKDLMTRKEVCDYLQCSQTSLWDWTRKGKIIAVVTENDTQMSSLADHTLEIPEVDEIFSPILSVIPLQLLSYHIATMRGCNVDQPRNLAKSVTVE